MEPRLEHARATATLHLDGDIAQAFVLFEPEGERRWAEGWDPEFIHPTSGVTAEGMVFSTPAGGGSAAIWVVTHYDADAHRVTYARVLPETHTSLITISCSAEGDGTRADVTYDVTALSPQGHEFVARFTEPHYGKWLAGWERAINHYLRTGELLRHHG